MKHLSYFLIGATGLLLASCSNEDLVSNGINPDGTANVTLTLSTPQIQTRAYSDGTTAQKLLYAVYEVTGDAASPKLNLINGEGFYSQDDESKAETIELKKQMTFKLLTDHTYRFVFWAESADDENDKPTNPYEIAFSDNQALLTVDYSKLNEGKVTCNNENLDAFFGGVELNITGNVQMDVPLSRPFAQINVGTNDLVDAKTLGYPDGDNKISSMIKTKTYTSMSLLDGEITGEKSDVQFSFAEIPAITDGKFPVTGYDYLAMTYILVPDEDDEVVDVTFNYKEDNETLDHTRTVGSVPVKRNHRTNIYGQILTSTADLNIHIEPAYDDPDLQPSELELAAALGGTVVLDDNVTLNDGERITFIKDAVVDLNGKDVTGASDKDGVFYITNGANVTIKGPGKVAVGENDEDYGIAVWANNGTVTIEGGTYEAKGVTSLIYSTGGTIIIKGGTFKVDDPEGQKFTLNLQDKNPTAEIIVMGGTFFNYDPSNSYSENPKANFVPKGYVVKENKIGNDTYYTVVPEGNKEAVVQMIGDKVYCMAPALPDNATEEQFEGVGGLYVEDGEVKTFEATGKAISEAMKTATELYFAPNSVIKTGSHTMQVQQEGITIHGNGATIEGGECDFSVQSYSNDAKNYPLFEENSTIDVNLYDLNNVKVWGSLNQTINLNVYLKNCTMAGNGLTDGSHSLIMVRGADGGESKVSITLEDCYAKNIQVGLHTMYAGEISVKNCIFDGVGIPVNYAKKLKDADAVVEVVNCEFNKCGIPENVTAWDYAAPIRVVDNEGPDNSTYLKVDNCTFTENQSDWDILLIDYRKDKTWFPVKYEITNCGEYSLRAE